MGVNYPINGSDLVRLLGLPHDSRNVRRVVRPLLSELGCPKTGSGGRSRWVVEREMAQRVAFVLRERGVSVVIP